MRNRTTNLFYAGCETAERIIDISDWFTIDQIDDDTYILSEYRHWEETHCYLLIGTVYSLLIDTWLGIANIFSEVSALTNNPIRAVATHIHWNHIGGHRYFPDFYAHEAELGWLNGAFPLSLTQIKKMVVDRCKLPEGYDVTEYEFFQGTPTRVLKNGDWLNLGGRAIQALHTPGHSPGHLCFFEPERGYLFTGDLVYKDTLLAYYPSTDPAAYLNSLTRVAELPTKRLFPAHHSLDIQPEILIRMRDAFRQLNAEGKLCHGSGTFSYGDWRCGFKRSFSRKSHPRFLRFTIKKTSSRRYYPASGGFLQSSVSRDSVHSVGAAFFVVAFSFLS